jgi:exodeoxyribonuclease VII small subunit
LYPPGSTWVWRKDSRIAGLNRPKNMPKASPKTPASYEAALEELEQLVGLIESGQLPLEQLLTGYQRGAELLAFCREKLQAVEAQIKVLDDGALKPWTQE